MRFRFHYGIAFIALILVFALANHLGAGEIAKLCGNLALMSFALFTLAGSVRSGNYDEDKADLIMNRVLFLMSTSILVISLASSLRG